jgi:hypothetical protein
MNLFVKLLNFNFVFGLSLDWGWYSMMYLSLTKKTSDCGSYQWMNFNVLLISTFEHTSLILVWFGPMAGMKHVYTWYWDWYEASIYIHEWHYLRSFLSLYWYKAGIASGHNFGRREDFFVFFPCSCHNPTLAKCGVKPNTWKSWDLESSGTPECSELDNKGKNTSHWGVLGVIGKVLKRRYRKCPRIGNSDIRSPSYGQKKSRESIWQFDSRPLKVENRPLPDVRFGSATWRWKDLDEGYNFGLDLVTIQLCSREFWRFKVPRVPPGQFRESREFVPFGCSPHGELQRIL